MSISIKRFSELCEIADKAARKGDHQTIETLNQDPELRSANVQFVVRDGVVYAAELSKQEVKSS